VKTSDAVVDRAYELAEMRRDDENGVEELVAIAMG
jgi:hypothetical protein